jgi:hypothetical protein
LDVNELTGDRDIHQRGVAGELAQGRVGGVGVEVVLFGESGPRDKGECEGVCADGGVAGRVRHTHHSKLLIRSQESLYGFGIGCGEVDERLLAFESESERPLETQRASDRQYDDSVILIVSGGVITFGTDF